MRVNRKEFSGALRSVKPAVSKRSGIPALSGVKIEAGLSGLVLSATDLEVSIRLECPAEIQPAEMPWTALVPFGPLADSVKAGAAHVDITPTDGKLPVAGVRVGSASIRCLPVEDFPTLTYGGEYRGRIDAQQLRSMVETVAPAASRDDSRPILTGILVEFDGADSQLTATDSYRLHHVETAGRLVEGLKVIIPARALELLGKRIGRKGSGSVVLESDQYGVGFRIDDDGPEYVLRSRVIEGEYPNYRQLLPEPMGANALLDYDVAELSAALEASKPFCSEEYGHNPVRLELNGKVEVSANSPDLGSFRSEITSGQWAGEEITTAYQPRYLLPAVKAAGEGARGEIRDGLKPAVFRSADGRTVALVMPVRLPAPVS